MIVRAWFGRAPADSSARNLNFTYILKAMNSVTQSDQELRTLRELCDTANSRERRLELLKSLDRSQFLDHEHQVVFESICFVLARTEVSKNRLAVNLNNRGFPDIELEKYLPAKSLNGTLDPNSVRKTP